MALLGCGCALCQRPIPQPVFDAERNLARSARYVEGRALHRRLNGLPETAGRSPGLVRSGDAP